MANDQNRLMEELLREARRLAQHERQRFLQERCPDPELKARIESLLNRAPDDPRSGDTPQPPDSVDVQPVSLDGAGEASVLERLSNSRPESSRYRSLGEIARGGMGAIFRVRDEILRRDLAMKVILGEGDGPAPASEDVDAASLERFLEEAQVTSQLDHPGIVPVHELGLDGEGRVYFTMKLVKGEEFREVLERVKSGQDGWNPTRALGVILRVCEAMAYAHAKGVIHRDLKPANIMVGRFGESYVMDWGLARVLAKADDRHLRPQSSRSLIVTDRTGGSPDSPLLTMDGHVVGTPAYMSPEQAEGRVADIGPHSDVYAMGAILYELITGQMPYVNREARISPRTILACVLAGPPEPILELNRTVPGELVAICEKAMAREIRDRYRDMNELAVDVRAYLEHRVVKAYSRGPVAELRKWIGRNRGVAATGAAALVLLFVLAAWSNVRIRAERNVALANEGLANENAEDARMERDRVMRLSDKRRLEVLLAEMDELWPAHPDRLAAMGQWLDRARSLLARLSLHEATLAEVRARGRPLAHPAEAELETLRARANDATVERSRAEQVALEQQIERLAAKIDRERAYDFDSEVDDRWWHDAVRDLVVGLHAFSADDAFGRTIASVAARERFAADVERRSIEEYRAEWEDAIAAIASRVEQPQYGGERISYQLGLVPLGKDRDSGLFEFAHLQTGAVPARDPTTGELEITAETGLVFVLIPGGRYSLGTQSQDPNAPNFYAEPSADESPVHAVGLEAYFLSKYEMTQGQWLRVAGHNPSWWAAGYPDLTSAAFPIENVSWEQVTHTLARLGLVLPTEAQWEAACRAGTETPWYCGSEPASLADCANLADASYAKAFTNATDYDEFDDGFGLVAPVGSLEPNAFGLYDMHGNVWEWCRDAFASYEQVGPRPEDGLRAGPDETQRIFRGGGFNRRADRARSANRFRGSPDSVSNGMGVRPARIVDR